LADLKYGEIPVQPDFWFLKAGLYHTENYTFDKCMSYGFINYRDNILSVIYPKITIDVYCLNCKRETVFLPVEREINWYNSKDQKIVKYGVHYAHFKCSRNQCRSELYYVFHFLNGKLTKIGQYPSIADLLSPKIKKYSAVMDSELISDWQRAIGLRAHGIGAGSYVYLRRIIERMVLEASSLAISDGQIDQEIFNRSRWPEKIKMLKSYLPQYLVENSMVYGVLSKGVHELSEDECADYFDVMHTSIEIICDQKIADLERTKKATEGAKALQKVLHKLKSEGA
jgi:hypothetical protein